MAQAMVVPPATEDVASPADDQPAEQRIVLYDVPWTRYLQVREALDSSGLKMTYDGGVLELMSPSREHESRKTMLGRLLEIYALERDVPLYGYGSTTFRRQAKEKGLEADECYVLGRTIEQAVNEVPDLAIEVILTSGGINKLDVYLGLGVPEVWFYRSDGIEVYVLQAEGSAAPRYEATEQSVLLPRLDLARLAKYVAQRDQHAAAKAYRAELLSECR